MAKGDAEFYAAIAPQRRSLYGPIECTPMPASVYIDDLKNGALPAMGVTKTHALQTEVSVTRNGGRPKKAEALTPAQKQKAYRERKAAKSVAR